MPRNSSLSLATSAPVEPEKPVPDEPRDELAVRASRLPQLSAEREAADAAVSAIDDPHQKQAAKRRLENCQKREGDSYFARERLALNAAFGAEASAIGSRILERTAAVDGERMRVRDAAAAASDARARRDALHAQREAVGSRQAEIDAALARLASASDSGDDAGAEAAAREIARIRRERAESVEPLDLRLQAAHEAVARAEAQQERAEEQMVIAVKALHEAELDRLKLARDEAAAALLDRDIALSAAGYYERASATLYEIGLTPAVLAHLRGHRLRVSDSFIRDRATERRIALEADRRDAA